MSDPPAVDRPGTTIDFFLHNNRTRKFKNGSVYSGSQILKCDIITLRGPFVYPYSHFMILLLSTFDYQIRKSSNINKRFQGWGFFDQKKEFFGQRLSARVPESLATLETKSLARFSNTAWLFSKSYSTKKNAWHIYILTNIARYISHYTIKFY